MDTLRSPRQPDRGGEGRPWRRERTNLTRLGVILVLALLAAASLYPRGDQAGVGAARSVAARVAISAGRYEEAARQVDRWLAVEPKSAPALCLKARVALALDRPEEFEVSYRRAAEAGGTADDLALLRALADVKRSRPELAEPVLRRAIERSVGPDPQLDEALARAYLGTFDLRRAEAAVDRWARDAPGDPKPYLLRAEVRRRAGAPAESLVDDYRQVLRRDPNLAEARLGLAEVLGANHRDAEAAAEFAAYLVLRPNDPAGHLGAGRNARTLGDDDEADAHLARAQALDPTNAEAHKERADIASRRGDASAALVHLDEALRLDPEDLDAHYRRGLVLKRLGRAEEAAQEQVTSRRLREDLDRLQGLKTQLLARPADLGLQVEVAQWMFDHKHDDAGADWARKILNQKPDHPVANRLLVDHHDRRGEAGLANFYRLKSDQPGRK